MTPPKLYTVAELATKTKLPASDIREVISRAMIPSSEGRYLFAPVYCALITMRQSGSQLCHRDQPSR